MLHSEFDHENGYCGYCGEGPTTSSSVDLSSPKEALAQITATLEKVKADAIENDWRLHRQTLLDVQGAIKAAAGVHLGDEGLDKRILREVTPGKDNGLTYQAGRNDGLRRAAAIVRSAGVNLGDEGLDAAWARAEAALPEHLDERSLSVWWDNRKPAGWWAACTHRFDPLRPVPLIVKGYPTKEAALNALAARLTEGDSR